MQAASRSSPRISRMGQEQRIDLRKRRVEQGMIRSLIKRLKSALRFKEPIESEGVCLDDAHEVVVPLMVTCCNFCSGRVAVEVGKKESGLCGRKLKIKCARNCKGWTSSALDSREFKNIFKKALGYLSTYYAIHKRMVDAVQSRKGG